MELKHATRRNALSECGLLIVPYGIETPARHSRNNAVCLLIVPYGIETMNRYKVNNPKSLLIVPYGIETLFCCLYSCCFLSFNRTLWN